MSGRYCAVSLCNNSSKKAKKGDMDNPKVSFHRFPGNKDIRNQWIKICKRSDEFNPNTARICSEHFKPEDFIRDLQAELLGYNPTRRLCPRAIPTRNIPNNPNRLKCVAAVRRLNRIEAKNKYEDHLNYLKDACLQTERPSTSSRLPDTDKREEIEEPSCSVRDVRTVDYKLLCEELKNKNSFLLDKVRNQTAKLKRASIIAKQLSSHSQTQIARLTKKIEQLQISLKLHPAFEKKKKLSVKVAVKEGVEEVLGKYFTSNQIQLLTQKKKKVHWTDEEILKALSLRSLDKRAYIYVRKTFKFPLPSISSLKNWTKMRNLKMDIATNYDLNIDHISSDTSDEELQGKEKLAYVPSGVSAEKEAKKEVFHQLDNDMDFGIFDATLFSFLNKNIL